MTDQDFDNIVVYGSVAYDEIMDFPGAFVDHIDGTKLHQINVSFVVDRLEKQLGGIATNICFNLRLLTKKKIQIVSAVGKDGASFFDFFKKNSIDTTHLVEEYDVYTATGKVITDTHDNQIWGYYYGPLAKAGATSFAGGGKSVFAILSATHKDAFLSHQSELISKKCIYMYDPGMALTWISNEDLAMGINNASYLIGNDYEIAQIEKRLGITKSELVKKGIAIITTLGDRGVLYEDFHNKYTVPAYAVSTLVDPTGAGDAWRGGFVAGLVDKKQLVECLIQANALASFAVSIYGTVNHHPTWEQLKTRMDSIRKLL